MSPTDSPNYKGTTAPPDVAPSAGVELRPNYVSDAQQAWLDRWGRWLDRAAELDREHEHTPGCRYEVYLNSDGNWRYSPMTQTAGAITVHSRAAAKALAAEMNAESVTVQGEVKP